MIHVFGDSLCKYFWPTWPNWIEKYTGEEVNNLSYPGYGAGNVYWNLIDAIPNITPTDKVIIMWTQNHRIVQWYEREWIDKKDALGFFPNNDGKLWFGEDYLGLYRTHPDHLHSFTDGVIQLFNFILNAQLLLESKNIEYQMVFSCNPWIDNRPAYEPKFKVNVHKWFENEKIKEDEIRHATKVLNLSPVKNIVNSIKWDKFFETPDNPFNPKEYGNFWDIQTERVKEYVAVQHERDCHPSPLVHHDYAVKLLGIEKPHLRDLAIKVAEDAITTPIPDFQDEDFVAPPTRHILDKRFLKDF
jgi:hypothetical protein